MPIDADTETIGYTTAVELARMIRQKDLSPIESVPADLKVLQASAA